MATAELDHTMDTADNFTTMQDALTQRVLLVSPTMGWWHGQYKVDEAEISVAGQVADKKRFTRPQVKLLESCDLALAWKNRFQALDTQRKNIVEKFSLSFPIRGVRIIPRRAANQFFQELIGPTDHGGRPRYDHTRNDEEQSVAYRLGLAADEFVANYSDIMQEIRANVEPEVWHRVSKAIPSPTRMRDHFYLDITPIELQGSGATKVTHEDLQEYEQHIREATERRVHEAIEEMVGGPRQALAKALQELHELIARDGRVSTKSFNPVRDAIEKLRLFSFIANDDLLQKIRELEQRLDVTVPSTLDPVTATANGFFDAIESVRQEVVDATRQAEDMERFGGREIRGLAV